MFIFSQDSTEHVDYELKVSIFVYFGYLKTDFTAE